MTYAGVVTAGASAALVKISSTTVSTAVTQIDFTGIPATYTSLELVISNATSSGNTTGADTINLRLNDATTGYYTEFHRFNANAVTSTSSTANSLIPIGNIYGAGGGGVQVCGLRATIHNYAKTATYRTVASQGTLLQGTTATSWRNGLFFGTWTDTTTAVNKVSLLLTSGLYQAGTVATLYGLT